MGNQTNPNQQGTSKKPSTSNDNTRDSDRNANKSGGGMSRDNKYSDSKKSTGNDQSRNDND